MKKETTGKLQRSCLAYENVELIYSICNILENKTKLLCGSVTFYYH